MENFETAYITQFVNNNRPRNFFDCDYFCSISIKGRIQAKEIKWELEIKVITFVTIVTSNMRGQK